MSNDSEPRIFEQFLDQSPSLVWLVDPTLRLQMVRGEPFAGRGRTDESWTGRPLEDLFSSDADGAPAIDAHRRALQGEHVSLRWTRDGTEFQLLVAPFYECSEGDERHDRRIVGASGAALPIGPADRARGGEAPSMFAKERRTLTRLLELYERDRQLIGFEIHDGIVQEMTATAMFLEAASDDVERAGMAIPDNLTRSLTILRGCIQEARRLIDGLRPPALDESGVVPAIEALIGEIGDKSGLEVEFRHAVAFDRLAPALEMAIYRIVQESLNNVWHHSQATTAEVSLEQHGDRVVIQVNDQGIGFDPARTDKKRYGIVGIRERARLLGGGATIDSRPGAGTRIRVELPITDIE